MKGLQGRLKICHVLASHAEIGGLEKNVIDLSAAQRAAGHEVFVVVTDQTAPYFPEDVRKVICRLDRSRRDPRLGWEVAKLIREIQPDIVHAHANKSGHVVGRARHKVGCPIVATVQNLKRDQSMFEAFDAVICASQIVADTLERQDAVVIHNAVGRVPESIVAEAAARPAPFMSDMEGRPVFFALGRFVEAKGYDLLLEALAQVPGASLWLIGDGPLRGNLERQVEELGLCERVWMPGFLDFGTGYLQMCGCFVISSRNEGGPYTLAEALRARVPVISTRVGYAPDYLDKFALCVEVGVEAIRERMEFFLQDPEGYRRAMEVAFERSEQGLTLETMVAGVERVYRSVLS